MNRANGTPDVLPPGIPFKHVDDEDRAAEKPAKPRRRRGSSAPPHTPDPGLTTRLADALRESMVFAADAGGALYRYDGGCYRPYARRALGMAILRVLKGWGQTKDWSQYRCSEVAVYLDFDSPELWPTPPTDRVNLANGILHITPDGAAELRPHTPEHLSTLQLPIRFDPAATCPAWESFCAATLPADVVADGVVWQLFAWLLTTDMSIQKAVLFLGAGANGKSTMLAGIAAFLGRGNIAATPLQTLESDRFAPANLFGKVANICADLPSTPLKGSTMFKLLTGGDPIRIERKHHDAFSTVPYVKLLFSANHPPRSPDASAAYFRRWLVLPFEQHFDGPAAKPRAELDAALASPGELSGVLNRALAALPTIRRSGITESPSMNTAHDDFRRATDPTLVWIEQHLHRDPDGAAPCEMVYAAIRESFLAKGYALPKRNQVGRTITEHFLGIDRKRRGPAGKQQWCYIGLAYSSKLKNTDYTDYGADEPHYTTDFGSYEREIIPTMEGENTDYGAGFGDADGDSDADSAPPPAPRASVPIVGIFGEPITDTDYEAPQPKAPNGPVVGIVGNNPTFISREYASTPDDSAAQPNESRVESAVHGGETEPRGTVIPFQPMAAGVVAPEQPTPAPPPTLTVPGVAVMPGPDGDRFVLVLGTDGGNAESVVLAEHDSPVPVGELMPIVPSVSLPFVAGRLAEQNDLALHLNFASRGVNGHPVDVEQLVDFVHRHRAVIMEVTAEQRKSAA